MNDKKNDIERMFNELRLLGVVKSQREFADKLGINENGLSRAFNGHEQYLTPSLYAKICSFYNENILQNEDYSTKIPIISVECHGGGLTDFRPDGVRPQDCEWVTSPVKGAEFAIQVTGDSMSPEYPNGSMVLIRKINEEAFIEWGKVYVLDTDNGIIIKELRPCPSDENKVECHSLNNHPRFAPYTIDRKFIRGWYRVLLQMALK